MGLSARSSTSGARGGRRTRVTTALLMSAGVAMVAAGCSSSTAQPGEDAAPSNTAASTDRSGGSSDTPTGDAGPGREAPLPPSAPAPTGAAILDISAPLVGGGQLDLGTLGDRPVLLWFWAPF